MKGLTILLIIILIFFCINNIFSKHIYLDRVKSTINDKTYYVRNLKDKQEAANKLATLGNNLRDLIKSLDISDNKYSEGIKRLSNKFNPDHITENIPGSQYVAYSLNKGEELSICIRDKKNDLFIDNNTIMFVAIHELAHIMSKSTGHTDEFWDNMRYLLNKAIKINLYQKVNYKDNPVMYCGMKIDNTPI